MKIIDIQKMYKDINIYKKQINDIYKNIPGKIYINDDIYKNIPGKININEIYHKDYKEECTPPRDNLIYSKAEPWAKQNIESFVVGVLNWIQTSVTGDKLKFTLSQFNIFTNGIFDLSILRLKDDKKRLDWIKLQLNELARIMGTTVPEELLAKATALFWSI